MARNESAAIAHDTDSAQGGRWRPLRFVAKILLVCAGVCVLLIVAVGNFVATFDWNRAKPWLVASVAHALGRPISIDGELTVAWQRDAELPGWRRWLPGPTVTASKVTIGNPEWSKMPAFASAQQVQFDLALLPLLAHTVSVPSLRFVDPAVHLERASSKRNNWTFAANEANSSSWRFEFGRVQLARGEISMSDQVKQLDATIVLEALHAPQSYAERAAQQEIASHRESAERVGAGGAREIAKNKAVAGVPRSEPQRYVFGWTATGKLRGKPVMGEGAIGGILALRNQQQPFPLHADIRIGDTRVAFVGTLTDPSDPEGLDLRLWLSGTSLAHLYDAFDVALPESPPFATNGHLTGRFGAHDLLRYENFSARVGDSDLAGDLAYETREPRPLLSGKIVSTLLQFRDLAPLIGANGTRGGGTAAAQSGKVLPEEPFRPERWRAMDADVQFSGDRVVRDAELPIHKIDTRVAMNDGVLTLDPLRFRYAYGDVEANIQMDGRSAPIKGTIKATANGVQLKHVFKVADSPQVDLGNANATANLTATGNSIGDMLGAANGEIKALMGDGSISKALIETISLNIPNIVLTKLVGDRQLQINCAAADFVATDGKYEARLFVIDTDAAQLNVTGSVDLANEQLELTVHPDSKGLRLLSLRAPIHISGPFAHPDTGLDKGVLLARGAGALGLAVAAAPAAALLPLTQTSLGARADPCAPLLQSIQRAAAPAKAK